MKRNSILFVIAALFAVMAMAGSAQAIQPVAGFVNSTTIDNTHIVTIYLDDNPGLTLTTTTFDMDPLNDGYQFNSIDSLLSAHVPPIPWLGTFNATIEMRCADGSNVYRNTTPTTAHLINAVHNGNTPFAPLMEIEPCSTPTNPDLIVASITPNCDGYLFGNESNTISAKIENIGNATAVASTACFVLSDGHSATAPVSQLAPGANETVTITDPTDRDAGDTVTITVTADCYDANPSEWNEANNASSLGPVTVVNNGYKGKTYTGGSNITTVKSYDLNGNLVYSVGDSYYLSSYYNPDWTTYNVSWTAGDLPVLGPIKEARLYVTYTWAKDGVMPDDVDVSFNGGDQEPEDAHYWDEKGFGTSYPYGMLVYNVTTDFNPAGNIANLTNSHIGGDNASMRGMLLVAIYENASEPRRLIYVNEEFDLLYGGSSKCTTPEEATAWAPITASIATATVANATLITVAPGAGPTEGELIFNGQVWNDVWNFAGNSQIGIDERDVASYLQSTDNLVGFQSSADYMEASNAFLVVEKMSEVVVKIDPCAAKIGSDPSDRTTVNISLNGIADYGSGTIHLYFDTTYVDIDSIGDGDSTNQISNKVTDGHYTISASNSNGTSGDVAFANVTFKPMGPTTGCSHLNLVVEKLYDRNFTSLDTVVTNCTICIEESNIPGVTTPTASPTRILNDNGRDRVQLPVSTNRSTLSVYVTDDTEVDTVTINLTPIRGAGCEAVSMTLVSGTKQAGTWEVETNATRDDGQDLPGINMTHCLVVNATDTHDNSNTASCVTLKVLRRGDIDPEDTAIPQNDKADIGDYNEIARYTVGLRSMPDEFTAGTVPADSHNGVDMADALYIAMYDVIPNYQAP